MRSFKDKKHSKKQMDYNSDFSTTNIELQKNNISDNGGNNEKQKI